MLIILGFLSLCVSSKTKPARATEAGPSVSNKDERRQSTTVVDSSITPAIEHDSRVSQLVRTTGGEIGNNITAYGRGMDTCDVAVTSSHGCSAASISANVEPTTHKPQGEARKRKAARRAAYEAKCYSEVGQPPFIGGRRGGGLFRGEIGEMVVGVVKDEVVKDVFHLMVHHQKRHNQTLLQDVEFEPANAKKQARGSTSAKRSRAAEVHNLSERRRRDRINEKMKALEELIPHCNKADKASMLDEAIEYLKSLHLQVQMMSMGCSMVPTIFPGGQHYMPPMGMDSSMSRPMVPYPSVLAGSPMPNPYTPFHLGPRFSMPAYHMQPVPSPDLSRLQTTHQSDPTLNPMASQNPSQPCIPNFSDPSKRSLGPHQMQLPIPQNQAMTQQNTTEPSTTTETLGHHQSG